MSETIPNIVGVAAIFIDDIVLPDGTTHMGQLGGGVLHALMGASIWGERAGLSALHGNNLDPQIPEYLAQHLDISGLVELELPQIRAWQLFEEDGKRTEVHRVAITQPFIEGAYPNHMPDNYKDAKAFYLHQTFEGMRRWAQVNNKLTLWEPSQLVMLPGKREEIREILQNQKIDVISPNLAETQTVYGDLPPKELINAMLDDGAQMVALRMGEDGSIIADKQTGKYEQIDVVNIKQIIDQTGAGNSYCGGLLAGLVQGKSLKEAAIMGTVSASFCLETTGILKPEQINSKERDKRLQALQNK